MTMSDVRLGSHWALSRTTRRSGTGPRSSSPTGCGHTRRSASARSSPSSRRRTTSRRSSASSARWCRSS